MTQPSRPAPGAAAGPEIVDPDPTAAEDYEVGLKSLNQWQLAWRKFRKHKLALIGLGMIVALILVAILGPVLMPFNFGDIPQLAPNEIVQQGRPPSLQHPTEPGPRS
jgi:peptide/nickel transport system permease protein